MFASYFFEIWPNTFAVGDIFLLLFCWTYKWSLFKSKITWQWSEKSSNLSLKSSARVRVTSAWTATVTAAATRLQKSITFEPMNQMCLNCCVFRHVHLKIRIRLVVLWALKEVRVNAVVLFIYSITIIEKSLQRFVIYLCRERTGAFRLLLRGRRPTRCRPLAFPVRRDGKLRCFGHVPPRHSGNAIALRVRRNQRRLRRRLFSVRSFFAKKNEDLWK